MRQDDGDFLSELLWSGVSGGAVHAARCTALRGGVIDVGLWAVKRFCQLDEVGTSLPVNDHLGMGRCLSLAP